jgi:hypothetical protein
LCSYGRGTMFHSQGRVCLACSSRNSGFWLWSQWEP